MCVCVYIYIYIYICIYTHTHMHFFRFFSIIGYYKILSAIQKVPVLYRRSL